MTTFRLLPLIALAVGCAPRPDPNGDGLVRLRGNCMGTTWSAVVVGAEQDREALTDTVQDELDLVDRHLSTWKEASDVSRISAAGADEPIEVAPVTVDVLRESDRLYGLTGGAFDPTVGPAVDLWGFGSSEVDGARAPSEAEIETARARLGWPSIEIGADTVRKARAEVRLDVSAIAKGIAVDRVAARLVAEGHPAFLLEVGGEMVLRGTKPDGTHWRVGVVDPTPRSLPSALTASAPGAPYGVLEITDVAVATSGDYRNVRRLADGRTVVHAIDPRTARPIEHDLASITVLAPTCGEADALATAALVLGPVAGLALLEGLPGVEAIGLVRRGGTLDLRRTSGAPDFVPKGVARDLQSGR